MPDLKSFRSIIELWPTREACASEIGNGATAAQISKWWQRDSIPSEWWLVLLETETVRGAGVSASDMIEIAARRPDAGLLVEARA